MPSSTGPPSTSHRVIHIAFAAILVIVTCFSGHVHSIDEAEAPAPQVLGPPKVLDSPLLTSKIQTNRTIKVDINGNGDFTSVQEAINSVPSGNGEWIIIHVRKGVYREKVHIPEDKPYIFMRGNGKGKTAIVWSQSSANNRASATFSVEAPHFVLSVLASRMRLLLGLLLPHRISQWQHLWVQT